MQQFKRGGVHGGMKGHGIWKSLLYSRKKMGQMMGRYIANALRVCVFEHFNNVKKIKRWKKISSLKYL